MTVGERLLTTPAGVRLCARDDIADGAARSFVLQMRAGRFHGFVVRKGDAFHGFVDRCPHAGLPLAKVLDAYLSPDASLISCAWHGALFAVDDGKCVGGPCIGQTLKAWPVGISDGWLETLGRSSVSELHHNELPQPPTTGARR
jgi:nitrite reductase/ring-hydroxylating ferredoxin subunit